MPDKNGVPITFEMDGLLTEKDIADRFKVVFQCKSCKKWTIHDREHSEELKPCENCGEINYDSTSIKSLRTYNPLTDNKRRPK